MTQKHEHSCRPKRFNMPGPAQQHAQPRHSARVGDTYRSDELQEESRWWVLQRACQVLLHTRIPHSKSRPHETLIPHTPNPTLSLGTIVLRDEHIICLYFGQRINGFTLHQQEKRPITISSLNRELRRGIAGVCYSVKGVQNGSDCQKQLDHSAAEGSLGPKHRRK